MCPESERGTYIGHSHTHTRGIKPDDENELTRKELKDSWYRQLRWKVQPQSGNCH